MSVRSKSRQVASGAAREMAHHFVGARERGLRDHIRSETNQLSKDRSSDSWRARAGQSVDIVGVFLTITVAAVIGYIGLTVMSETEDTAEFETNSEFDNASSDLTQGVGTSMGLSEVLFIVLILGAIIGVLVGLRRR